MLTSGVPYRGPVTGCMNSARTVAKDRHTLAIKAKVIPLNNTTAMWPRPALIHADSIENGWPSRHAFASPLTPITAPNNDIGNSLHAAASTAAFRPTDTRFISSRWSMFERHCHSYYLPRREFAEVSWQNLLVRPLRGVRALLAARATICDSGYSSAAAGPKNSYRLWLAGTPRSVK